MGNGLIYEIDFTDLPVDPLPVPNWISYSADRVSRANVKGGDGALNLWCRPDADGNGWRGGSMILNIPRKFGRFVVHCRLDAANYTKGLLMLWPHDEVWPPEIDFLEIGDDHANRQVNTMTAHYGEVDPSTGKHPQIHRSYNADMTAWHIVACAWRPTQITGRLDTKIMPNRWQPKGQSLTTQFPNPGIDGTMRLHMTYWPTNRPDHPTPWPTEESRMQISKVEVWG